MELALTLYLAGLCGAYALIEIATLFTTVPIFWRLLAAAAWPAIVVVFLAAVILASVYAALAERVGDDGWLQ